MSIEANSALLIGALLSLGSLQFPLLLVPAILIPSWSLLYAAIFSRRHRTFYNIIDKNKKNGNLPPVTAAAALLKSTDTNGNSNDIMSIWRVSPAFGASPLQCSSLAPLTCLPAPWESSSLMYAIVGEGANISKVDLSKGIAMWMGVGDSEGYAMRCENEEPKRFKFTRIGRVDELQPNNPRNTPFVSDIADPFLETVAAVTNVKEDKRKAALSNKTALDETIRCGDIVILHDAQTNKHLATSGWWVIFTSDAPTTNAYFVITILNEDGSIRYGHPVTAGTAFKLRSAKFPRYEVGCQSTPSIENKGNLLVMYEFPKLAARSTVRWKHGGLVNPLFLCGLPDEVQTSIDPTTTLQRKSNWNIYGGLITVLSYLRRYPISNVRVVGHAELLHRLLNKVFLVAVVVVTGSDEYGSKEWTCFKSPQEVDKILASVETQQVAVLKERGLASTASNGNALVGDKGSAAGGKLQHESPMAQDIRLQNRRFAEVLKEDSKAGGIARGLFLSAFRHTGLWDCWILEGSAKEMGVTLTVDKVLGSPLLMIGTARMLWESHFREELCVLYGTQLVLYPPMSNKPSWVLPLRDIVGLGDVLLEESPLPGTYALRIETMGRVYYLSCRGYKTREVLRDAVAAQIASLATLDVRSFPSSSLGGASPDSYTHLSGQWLPTTRLILNSRRFPFDSQSRSARSSWLGGETYWRLSEHLLQAASDIEALHYERTKGMESKKPLSPGNAVSAVYDEAVENALKNKLLSFLDETVALRLIDLGSIDLTSNEALCFFSNVYHTLLLHARTVLRLPSKSDWGLFFSSVSYAIGENVFSLSELEQCVLRGKLSRPRITSRHEASLIPLSDSHFDYALHKSDLRIDFLINSGSVSHPEGIYLLTPRNMETQLNSASQAVLVHSASVDFSNHIVTLPKLCECYREDLGGSDSGMVLRNCLNHSAKSTLGSDLEAILTSNPSRVPYIKYLLWTYESRGKLVLIK